MLTAERQRPALAPKRTTNLLTPPDSMLLQLPANKVAETDLGTDDIKMVVNDLLTVSGGYAGNDRTAKHMAGLHAKQLGYDQDILFLNWHAGGLHLPRPRILINLEIISRSDKKSKERQGCFSVEENFGAKIKRSNELTFRALEVDLDVFKETGEIQVRQVEEQTPNRHMAHVVDHEHDHGLGIRFPFRAESIKDFYKITNRKTFFTPAGLVGLGRRRISHDEHSELIKQATPLAR